MSTFTKSALIATVLATASVMASAAPTARTGAEGEQLAVLQGGGTLHIYKDGTMAAENAYGRPTVVTPGQLLHEKNGTTIAMKGDEVGRLSMEQHRLTHG